MVEITDPDLNQALEHYEEMLEALIRYRETLKERRARYEAAERDPKGYLSVMSGNVKRIDRLEQALEGDVYDLLRHVLDGSGVLASVDEERWI